jgi:hypothetical protein
MATSVGKAEFQKFIPQKKHILQLEVVPTRHHKTKIVLFS